ncbi:MAG: peptidyl-prolyl cis-trans isomerase [Candidatus Aminicenantes bacterium]|nr:peptidyl-prolyl cis-trans isomerase [Candidatus Aminicenantes bacterium]
MKNLELKTRAGFSLLVTFLILLSLSCQNKSAEEPLLSGNLNDPQKMNNIVLKIEDSFYFNTDFENFLRSLFGDEYKGLSLGSLSRIFDDFVDEKIYLHAAQKSEISLSVDEQKQYLAKLSREHQPEGNIDSLKQEEITALINRLRIEKYMSQKVTHIDVSDDEITEYYDLNKREFLRPERVKVSQILTEKEDKAIEILENVKNAAEETFREIARKESSGVEAAKGGDMGIFEQGQLPFEMERVIFSLGVGEVSPVVESTYGYHIFRLDAKFESELVPQEMVSEEIKIKILNQKIKQHLAEHLSSLKSQWDWKSYPSNLSFQYQRMDYEDN